MKNDFIEGMEVLINCKQLVEDLVSETESKIERLYRMGRDTSYLEGQRNRYLKVLNKK